MTRHAVIVFIVGALLSGYDTARADCTADSTCPDPARIDDLRRYLELFGEAVEIQQYAEAEELAKRIMELSIVVNGRDSTSSANALANLALVQHRQEQYDIAKQNYQAAIRTVERSDGNLSAALIPPLQGLGETELALENIEGARDAFERAIHISHVVDGPRNSQQIESLDAIAETYFLAGNLKRTLDVQQNIYALQVRAAGPDGEAMIPALQHYADWMHRMELYNRERNAYLEMLRLQQKHLGENNPKMIPTLIALGISRYNVGYSSLDSLYVQRAAGPDYYLKRAYRIASEQPGSNWQLAADTALAIGDYYTRAHRFARARFAYIEAWERMSASPEGINARREQLESAKLIETPYLPKFYENQRPLFQPKNTDDFKRGAITAEFDVNYSGRAVNIRLTESVPPGLIEIERRLVDTLKYVMHRPRFEDGERANAYGLTYAYEFSYRD